MKAKTNKRNEHGVKDCGDTYRQGGKLIQWSDFPATNKDTVKAWAKRVSIKHRIVKLDDGMLRLFVDSLRINDVEPIIDKELGY